jgi:hypothetical protein
VRALPDSGSCVQIAGFEFAPLSRGITSIIRGTVVNIDPRFGTDAEPLTAVSLADSTVTFHGAPAPTTPKLIFRGGKLSDGTILEYSSVPQLGENDEYLFFLREEYHISPLVPATDSLFRYLPAKGGQKVLVDPGGRGIRASAALGTVRVGKIAESLNERRQVRTSSSRQSVSNLAGDTVDPQGASPAADLQDLIRDMGREFDTTGVRFPSLPKSLTRKGG